MDSDSLILSIAELARTTWQRDKQPLLISNIPRQIPDKDFRAVLGTEGVKGFVARTCDAGKYKLVEDPNHKARVGIIPADETYEFPTSTKHPVAGEKHKGETMRRFLELLGELSENEQRSVVIPINVITKLLQK